MRVHGCAIDTARGGCRLPSDQLEILHRHPGSCLVCAYRNVFITVWYGRADDTAAEVIERFLPGRTERYPDGIAGVHVICQSAGLPPQGARQVLTESARRWSKQTAGVAVVLERAGFSGSAMRSVVTGIILLSRSEVPIEICGSLSEAAAWLQRTTDAKTGVRSTTAELHEAMQSARRIGLEAVEQPQLR